MPSAIGPRTSSSEAAELLAAPDPLQHGQPARQRARGAGVPRRAISRTLGFDVQAARRATPERPNLVARLRGAARRPDARLPRPRRHGARRRPRTGRTTRGRARSPTGYLWGRGALDMKSQIAAEASPRSRAGARGLAAGGGRPAGRSRSPTRRPAARSARSGSARTTPTRCAATTCSTRARGAVLRVRRPARVYGVCVRREGRLPLHASTTDGVGGPRVDARAGRQRAAQARAADLERLGRRASRASTSPRSRARCSTALGVDATATRRPRSSACARSTRGSRCSRADAAA